MQRPPRTILVINQPWSNHGDEAAHKALVRMLRARFPAAKIQVLAYDWIATPLDLEVFRPSDVDGVEYVTIDRPASRLRLRWCSRLPRALAARIVRTSSGYARAFDLMRRADLIVSAPGGVSLGPYRDWHHLSLLLLASESASPYAIYSVSFGPLPDSNAADRRFTSLALEVLRGADFLSLRETFSQRSAEQLGIEFVAATDTAFIDDSMEAVPEDLAARLASGYVVVVPNELHAWHPRHPAANQPVFDALYRRVIAEALAVAPQVVLMPQLFGKQNDARYDGYLRARFGEEDRARILVAPEEISVEAQKSLIAGAEMLVSARSHPTIFALHTGTPFLALSYEHKMASLLEQAGLSEQGISIEDVNKIDLDVVSARLAEIHGARSTVRDRIGKEVEAIRAVARRTADTFAHRFGSAEAG